jgi:hypothetical protein
METFNLAAFQNQLNKRESWVLPACIPIKDIGKCPRKLVEQYRQGNSFLTTTARLDSSVLEYAAKELSTAFLSSYCYKPESFAIFPFLYHYDGYIVFPDQQIGVLIRTVKAADQLPVPGNKTIPISWEFQCQALLLQFPQWSSLLVAAVAKDNGIIRLTQVFRSEKLQQIMFDKMALIRQFLDTGLLPNCQCGECK